MADWIFARFDSESSPLVQTSWTSFVTCELPCDCHCVRDMNRIRTYFHDEYNSSYWIRIEFQYIFPLCDFVDTVSRCNISIIYTPHFLTRRYMQLNMDDFFGCFFQNVCVFPKIGETPQNGW